MQGDKDNKPFQYTYSAAEQEELLRIRAKYISDTDREESNLERLRRLDLSVLQKAQTIALSLGIVGILILGFGMSLVMSELGEMLGLDGVASIAVGTLVGTLGGAVAGFAYPVYNLILKKEREKITPEIIRLADELLK